MHSYTLRVVGVGTRWITFAVILGGLTFQAQLERFVFPNAHIGDSMIINAEISVFQGPEVYISRKKANADTDDTSSPRGISTAPSADPDGEIIIDTRNKSGIGFRIIYNKEQKMAWYIPSDDYEDTLYGASSEMRSVSVTPDIEEKIERLRRL